MKEAGLKILLVDDSVIDSLLTTKLIERDTPPDSRVQITRAANLRDAGALLQSATVDCVLLDWNMPDGRRDNVGTLRSIAPEVPIVVLSGMEDPAAMRKALADGARAFVIKKPLSESEDLFALISGLVQQPQAPAAPRE